MILPIYKLSLKTYPALLEGIYQHYKGKYYLVLFVSIHTETNEELVIYQKLYDDFKVCARPLSMFIENVDYNGAVHPRFKYTADNTQVEKFIQENRK